MHEYKNNIIHFYAQEYILYILHYTVGHVLYPYALFTQNAPHVLLYTVKH